MRALPLVTALLLSACGWVSFGRIVSDDELRLRSEVRSYYDEVARAFATGNAEALSRLYDPAIARPMTREQILAWGKDRAKSPPTPTPPVELSAREAQRYSYVRAIAAQCATSSSTDAPFIAASDSMPAW